MLSDIGRKLVSAFQKYVPKKFSTMKKCLESFQISNKKEADFEIREERKYSSSDRNPYRKWLSNDLYIEYFRFVYISFSIYILIVFILYTDCK